MNETALSIYRGRSLEWFAGKPKFVRHLNELKFGAQMLPAARQPWGRFEIALRPFGAEVFDGAELIAGHGWQRDTSLWVHHLFRGRGVATALIVQCAIYQPGQRHSKERSPGGHASYVKAWPILQAILHGDDILPARLIRG